MGTNNNQQKMQTQLVSGHAFPDKRQPQVRLQLFKDDGTPIDVIESLIYFGTTRQEMQDQISLIGDRVHALENPTD